MFKNAYQCGFLSILYSLGSNPLQLWASACDKAHGSVSRVIDEDINSYVVELVGSNVATNYISCPLNPKKTLGIRLPYVVLLVKNMNLMFSFEIQVLDDQKVRRRFRVSNYQSCTRVKPFICTMPLTLEPNWNQIRFDLADFTRRAYGTSYVETLRVSLHANCRVRRVYFCDQIYADDDLPKEFKLYASRTYPKPSAT